MNTALVPDRILVKRLQAEIERLKRLIMSQGDRDGGSGTTGSHGGGGAMAAQVRHKVSAPGARVALALAPACWLSTNSPLCFSLLQIMSLEEEIARAKATNNQLLLALQKVHGADGSIACFGACALCSASRLFAAGVCHVCMCVPLNDPPDANSSVRHPAKCLVALRSRGRRRPHSQAGC
jgi:hypothetical protein